MKKLKLTILFLMLFIPAKVLGYGIENYYINATVEKNGDLTVQEYYEMNGEFNGSNRTIKFRNNNTKNFNPDSDSYGGSSIHNGDSIEIEEVRSVDYDDNFDFDNVGGTIFNRVNNARSGDYGKYTLTDDYANDGKTLKIFLPSGRNRAFYIKYKIHNIAIQHNDIGELGWNIFNNQSSESIGNLVVYLNVPGNKNTMKVWAHGPLNGVSTILSQEKVKVSIRGLDSYTAVDARIAFDKESVSDSTKKTYVNALDKIINYETELAEEANKRREASDKMNINYIESRFVDLDKTPSREMYDDILYRIDKLNASDKKTEYYSKLHGYQDKVDVYEYNRFKDFLDNEVNTNNYNRAKEIINNVFSIKVREKMEKELKEYHQKLEWIDAKKEICLCIISLGTLAITLLVYYKPLKTKKRVNPLYFRDIPSDISPASAGILVDKQINKNEVSASILDLIRRKIITIEKKNNKSYDFVLKEKFENLSEIDKNLVLLIFSNKNTTRVNSKKIKRITATKFNKYKESIINELEERKLMKDYVPGLDEINGVLFEVGLIFSFTPLLPVGFLLIILYSIMRYHHNFYIWVLKMLNIALMIISIVINRNAPHITIFVGIFAMIWISSILKKLPIKLNIKYTEEGKEEYIKWHGLRNFLMDFSKIDDKEIEEIALWEKYLVYATALGVSEKVLKAIRLKIEQVDPKLDYGTLNDMLMLDKVSTSISRISNSVVAQSLPTATFPIASAIGSASGGSYSSGSGGGGGFSGGSSGGGSFGGGGSVGRF